MLKREPETEANLSSFDLVQRSVETASSVHILPPCPLFLDRHRALLITVDVLSLCTSEPGHTHHGHHTCVVVHVLAFFVGLVRSIRIEI